MPEEVSHLAAYLLGRILKYDKYSPVFSCGGARDLNHLTGIDAGGTGIGLLALNSCVNVGVSP